MELNFENGFCGVIPDKYNCDGIYCVFAATKNASSSVTNLRLLYIGQSKCDGGVGKRCSTQHEHYQDWLNQLKEGEVLYTKYAELPAKDLDKAESAMIYALQPPVNENGKEDFHHPDTDITIKGRTVGFSSTSFTVKRTA